MINLTLFSIFFSSCAKFKAERVDNQKSDDLAMEITDNWMTEDTRQAVAQIVKQMKDHPNYKKFMSRFDGQPKVFIAQMQNQTSEAYFPTNEINDEFLNVISHDGKMVLVDNQARDLILKEITYQNDGMVDPASAKKIGKQLGADALIIGTVFMRSEKRDAKRIKEYTLNVRFTDLELGIEVLRTRAQVNKFSNASDRGL